ncbi:MAG: 16S rRNA (uracil(1498)-N(3))-methyltransferase [Bacteroidetes bacterium]|nr:MAG: 16S rRNA (uracil(1498)-N(3))-methyltransferase [Bacteroidota bacterium]
MDAYFVPALSSGVVPLPDGESRHCARVMRRRPGDVVLLFDGVGHRAEGRLVSVSQSVTTVEVGEVSLEPLTPGRRTWLAVAPTKQMERMEWMLEKAVEVGLGRISFMACEHSERRAVKLERLERVAIAAAKQSQTAYVPQIDAMVDFKEFLLLAKEKYNIFAGHLAPGESVPLGYALGEGELPACVLIGPEGGFSDLELEMLRGQGVRPVSLGTNRLRTETAGLVACVACASVGLDRLI